MVNYNIIVKLNNGESFHIVGKTDADLREEENFSQFRKIMNSYDVVRVTTVDRKSMYLEINNICAWEVL